MVLITNNDVVVPGDVSVGGNIVNAALTDVVGTIVKACDAYGMGGDAYISVTKTLSIRNNGFLDAGDSESTPVYTLGAGYVYCPGLDGTFVNPASDRYEAFYFSPMQIPFDYLSGGIVKIYCFQTSATSGKVAYEINVIGTRNGSAISSASWSVGGGGPFVSGVMPATAGTIFKLAELDISHVAIAPNDYFVISVVRSSNNANDTASSGAMSIIGAELVYISNTKVG